MMTSERVDVRAALSAGSSTFLSASKGCWSRKKVVSCVVMASTTDVCSPLTGSVRSAVIERVDAAVALGPCHGAEATLDQVLLLRSQDDGRAAVHEVAEVRELGGSMAMARAPQGAPQCPWTAGPRRPENERLNRRAPAEAAGRAPSGAADAGLAAPAADRGGRALPQSMTPPQPSPSIPQSGRAPRRSAACTSCVGPAARP